MSQPTSDPQPTVNPWYGVGNLFLVVIVAVMIGLGFLLFREDPSARCQRIAFESLSQRPKTSDLGWAGEHCIGNVAR